MPFLFRNESVIPNLDNRHCGSIASIFKWREINSNAYSIPSYGEVPEGRGGCMNECHQKTSTNE